MATFDGINDSRISLVETVTVAGDGTTNGSVVIDAQGALGVSFYMLVTAYTSGTISLEAETGDDAALADAAAVDGYVYALPAQDAVAGVTAASVPLVPMAKMGVIGGKRYYRANVVGAGGAAGEVMIFAKIDPSVKPA